MAHPPARRTASQVKTLNSKRFITAVKWISRGNAWVFKITNGRLGNKVVGKGVVVGVLTTKGRKTGKPRDTPLIYLREGNRVILVASQGGRETNPMWYLNLKADPSVTFQTKGETLNLIAREASKGERDEYWPKLDRMYPAFVNYRSYTDRELPIVICDP